MWNKDKSVMLTQIIVKSCYVLLALAVVGLPFILKYYPYPFVNIDLLEELGEYIIAPFYCVVPLGYTALVCIDKLLGNIKNGVVFNKQNVKYLRLISWCCFGAAFVGLLSFAIIWAVYMPFETFLVLVAGEIFMGLILRVVKNCFEEAIALKEENELTI